MVTYNTDRLVDFNYALAVVCSEFLSFCPAHAEEFIARLCHERGLALGELLAAKVGERSFRDAVLAFVAASEKSRAPASLVSLDTGKAVIRGTACPLGLEGRGREICEAMMFLDRGILEAASGETLRHVIVRSRAAGDEYCEVIFEVRPEGERGFGTE